MIYALWIGIGAGVAALAPLLWSLAVPARRIWPPITVTRLHLVVIWGVTFMLFGAVVVLAVLGWGEWEFPLMIRALGGVLLVAGHALMVPQVRRFGVAKTSGAGNGLLTDGAYGYSRNPQYLGDIAILLGWGLISGAPLVWPVAGLGILALLVAPFTEEPWLEARYGQAYRDYCTRVRRFV